MYRVRADSQAGGLARNPGKQDPPKRQSTLTHEKFPLSLHERSESGGQAIFTSSESEAIESTSCGGGERCHCARYGSPAIISAFGKEWTKRATNGVASQRCARVAGIRCLPAKAILVVLEAANGQSYWAKSFRSSFCICRAALQGALGGRSAQQHDPSSPCWSVYTICPPESISKVSGQP